jgi:hypothetical protein
MGPLLGLPLPSWQLVDGTSYKNDDDEDQYGAVLWLSFQEGGGQEAGVEGAQGPVALAVGVPRVCRCGSARVRRYGSARVCR